jgi:hypothetical protein
LFITVHFKGDLLEKFIILLLKNADFLAEFFMNFLYKRGLWASVDCGCLL